MITITADQAYEIATEVLQKREKEEKELQDIFSYIQERAMQGAFWARTPVCLSRNNINILKRYGFHVFNIRNDDRDPLHILSAGTHICWYKET